MTTIRNVSIWRPLWYRNRYGNRHPTDMHKPTSIRYLSDGRFLTGYVSFSTYLVTDTSPSKVSQLAIFIST